jgi:hypothetical protein
MKRTIVLLLVLLCSAPVLLAQKKIAKDTIPSRTFGFSATYAYQVPGGDLARRFGNNSSAGASLMFKGANNLHFGLNWAYIFSNTLKETGILDSIKTSDGTVIDKEGKYADIRFFERGFTLNLSCGYLLPKILSPNPNSGILLTGGIGYLQHKIRIYDNGARSPQLAGDYLKGYDRLTSGIAFTEFAGYWYQSPRPYINFFAGFEFTQGFTQSRRSWDYDLMRADTEKRIDLLSGIRVGWLIPIGRHDTDNRYYY